MHTPMIKSAIQKTSAIAISAVMVITLSLPIPVTVRAEGATDARATPASSADSKSTTLPDDTNSTSKTAPPQSMPSQTPQTSESQNTGQQLQAKQPDTSNSPASTSLPRTSTNVDSTAPYTHNDAQTDAAISNSIGSHATSGNASASQNTTVDDVQSGNAAALATIVNLLQSNVNLNGAQPMTFIQDITGTVSGDLIVDPAVIAAVGTQTNLFNTTNANPTVDASTQASITNAINIDAASGNANAHQNTTVGDLQTGSANSVANVVNLINSSINSGQSFIGMVNIYGNLQGNILVPEAFVNSILGTGTHAPTTNGAIVTTDNNASVVNNINTTAQSGTASATDNTTIGTVSTGQAATNVTILNLTSNQTVGKNALLVFVNVLGNWVGLIMDAPAGTTSASLGGGISTQSTSNPNALNANNNYQINNAITTASRTGNANATENTTVGDVRSGDASSSVNLLNILNSQISLSDWFGILFINVFGSWNGNFGVQTAAITLPNEGNSSVSGSTGSNNNYASPPSQRAVFRFIPSGQRGYPYRTFESYANTTPLSAPSNSAAIDTRYAPAETGSTGQPTVLGSTDSDKRGDNANLQSNKNNMEEQGLRWWFLPLIALAALLLAIRHYVVVRRQKNAEEDISI